MVTQVVNVVVNVDLSKGFKTAHLKDNALAPRPC